MISSCAGNERIRLTVLPCPSDVSALNAGFPPLFLRSVLALTAGLESLQVRSKATGRGVAGSLSVDMRLRSITFHPDEDLEPNTHYQAVFNKPVNSGDERAPPGGGGMMHSRASRPVEGVMRWCFFTVGYTPLRVTSFYPPPYSTVSASACRIVISFSAALHPGCCEMGARDWVRVRGSDGERCDCHTMLDPVYDEESHSLIFESCRPFVPGEIVRVRVFGGLVVGAEGQSMLPMQPEGVNRTNPFSWRFTVAQESLYEPVLQKACGVKDLLQKHAAVRDASPPTPISPMTPLKTLTSFGSFSDWGATPGTPSSSASSGKDTSRWAVGGEGAELLMAIARRGLVGLLGGGAFDLGDVSNSPTPRLVGATTPPSGAAKGGIAVTPSGHSTFGSDEPLVEGGRGGRARREWGAEHEHGMWGDDVGEAWAVSEARDRPSDIDALAGSNLFGSSGGASRGGVAGIGRGLKGKGGWGQSVPMSEASRGNVEGEDDGGKEAVSLKEKQARLLKECGLNDEAIDRALGGVTQGGLQLEVAERFGGSEGGSALR